MTNALLFILGFILISIVFTKIAKILLKKIENEKTKDYLQYEKLKSLEDTDTIDKNISKSTEAKTQKESDIPLVEKSIKHEFKQVLHKQNSSASRKTPQDFNEEQNLDKKYNKHVYRDKKGKFKSNKKWKKQQETS